MLDASQTRAVLMAARAIADALDEENIPAAQSAVVPLLELLDASVRFDLGRFGSPGEARSWIDGVRDQIEALRAEAESLGYTDIVDDATAFIEDIADAGQGPDG